MADFTQTPTQVTQNQIGFAPQVAPYAENLLGQAQSLTDVSQNPYMQYQGERTAQFSPLQQMSYQNAALMQTSPQLQDATSMAGLAGLGALNTGYTYNPLTAQSFTDSGMASKYMSPYMQGVVDVQSQQAKRQADIAAQTQQAQAARSGAFGGGRDAIMRSQANAELQRNLQGIQATGLQNAWQQAQQQFNQEQGQRQNAAQLNAQQAQYGAGLGLQGLQTALQASGQLGNLGQTQYGQNIGLLNLQNQFGQQQQQQAQRDLDTKYQDYLNYMNYPYKQIGFMSDVLRGAPLMQTGSSVYQAPPSTASQIAGLGLGTAGLMKAFAAEGGVMRLADGGSVTDDYNVENILNDLSDQQLAKARAEAVNKRDIGRVQMIDEEMAQRASLRSGMGSAFNALPQQAQQRVLSAASGGMVAFADNPDQPVSQDMPATYSDPSGMGTTEMMGAANTAPAYAGPNILERIFSAPVEPWRQELRQQAAAQKPTEKPAAPKAEKTAEAAPEAKPEVKLSRTEKSLASQMNRAIKAQAPEKAVDMDIADYFRMMKSSENEKRWNEIVSLTKEMSKLPEYDKNDALAKFGFAMAQAGSRPQGGRSGIQAFLASAAEAAPTVIAHREEYDKKVQDAKKIGAQMQIELLKAKMAEDKEDQRSAIQHWHNVQNLKLQEKKLAQDAAYHQAALSKPGTGLMAVYEELQRNPEAAATLKKAAEISSTGLMYKTDTGITGKQGSEIATEKAKDMTLKLLDMKMQTEKDPAKLQDIQVKKAMREREIEQRVMSSYGNQPTSGVSSGYEIVGKRPG